jgi:molybdopterin-containing oxidoreductase family iron-sulfur binding subunit
MKRAPFPLREDLSGKSYWRSLGELEGSPEFTESLPAEFPEGAAELPAGVGRRQFLTIMGASMALAGLTGCRRPEEKIVPYARRPEEVIPGTPLYFATAMPFQGTAVGLVVESHEGRPTKVEGNPMHPDSLGATSAFVQASVLDLYDPDRSLAPSERGTERSWDDAAAFLRGVGEKLRAKRGKGLAILTDEQRSPTLARVLAELSAAMPEAKVVRYEPFSREAVRRGTRLAFGKTYETVLDVAKARVIVALDSDFLANEGSPVKQARGFAEGRQPEATKAAMSRLYVIESTHSITGGNADERLRLQSRKIGGFVAELARELATAHKLDLGTELVAALPPGDLDARGQRWIKAVAKDLAANKGRGLVVAGNDQPAEVHAVVHLMNLALTNTGNTVRHVAAFDETPEGPAALLDLAKAIHDKTVDTLLVLGGNPAFDAPADARFADALGEVATSVHLSTHANETSAKATWHLNRAHYLEGWSDVRAEDGTASVVQPLIAPLFGGRTDAEVVNLLLGGAHRAYDLVRATWQKNADPGFEKAWRRALHDGLWQGSAAALEPVAPRPADVAAALRARKPQAGGLEVTFRPDPHAFDGRYANNGWLQELPDSMGKMTWGNAAVLSPTTAKALGVQDGDVLTLAVDGAQAQLPALVIPGHADESITLTVGLGRSVVGRVGKGVGVDVGPLRKSAGFGAAAATATKAGTKVALARTQEHFAMEGRGMVQEGDLAEYLKEPEFVEKRKERLPLFSLWDEKKYEGHKWGMAIDLNACIGCNACTIACQSENNIPIVGPANVMNSREMHWIRVDRYFEGEHPEEATTVTQPTLCNHCESAPCEQVCPVGATTHSPEGLNDMAYNRCVGTRYCANNCPFKVRRYNFLDYHGDLTEIQKLAMNPDVTVRYRGVMEKCTFCVQRINHAKIDAHREGRERVADGAIVTACQQVCPTQAISFGDLNDGKSVVAKQASNPRAYKLLEELNIKPRISYLARIKNPNPELVGA